MCLAGSLPLGQLDELCPFHRGGHGGSERLESLSLGAYDQGDLGVLPSRDPEPVKARGQHCSDRCLVRQGLLAVGFPAQVAALCHRSRLRGAGCKADRPGLVIQARPGTPSALPT